MKRGLSILLIIVMLLSVVVMAIPASAASDTRGLKEWDTPWDDEPGQWTPISSSEALCSIVSGSADKLTKYYLTADIVMDNSVSHKSPKYFILDGNGHSITVTDERSSIFATPENAKVRNLIIDGSVEIENADNAFNSPFSMYNTSGWIEMENVISNVNITYSKCTNRFQSVSGVWQSSATGSYFKDVTYNGTIFIEDGSLIDYMGAIIGKATGTTFENVVNNGDIIFLGQVTTMSYTLKEVEENGKKVQKLEGYMVTDQTKSKDANNGNKEYVSKTTTYQGHNDEKFQLGGFVGTASGCTFIDCVNNGSMVYGGVKNTVEIKSTIVTYNPDGSVLQQEITETDANGNEVKKKVDKTTAVKRSANVELERLGGFVGEASGTCTFKNCRNNALIVLNAYDTRYAFAGGFVGYVSGSASFEECTNNCDIKATQDGTWYIAGFAGYCGTKGTYTFDKCANNGKLTSYNTGKGSDSICGIAGFVGYADGSNTFEISFNDCANNGDFKTNNSAKMYKEYWGGFIAQGIFMTKASFTRCINNGDLVRPFAESDKFYEGTAGFIGAFRRMGKSPWTTMTNGEVSFTDCINFGDISGLRAGGFYGATTESDLSDTVLVENLKVNFTNCVNVGDITGSKMAGGLVGGYHASNGDGPFTFTVTKCANGGKVTSSNNAGGLFGMISEKAVVNISNCVNYGDIGEKDVVTGAPAAAVAAGLVAKAAQISVKNSMNLGYVQGKMMNPIAVASFEAKGNKYLSTSIEEGDYGDMLAFPDATAMAAAIDQMGLIASNYKSMLNDIAEYRNYNSTTHIDMTDDNSGFIKLKEACDAAEASIKKDMLDPLNYTQKQANECYTLLVNALANLQEKINFTKLKELLDSANEKLNDGNRYSDTSVEKLKAEMDAANALIDKGNDAKNKEVNNAIKSLENAINTLRRVRPIGEEEDTTTPDVEKPTEKPTDTPAGDATGDATGDANVDATQPSTDAPSEGDTQPVEESGCGSVIGGAAVVMVAVAALGAGLALKKKED